MINEIKKLIETLIPSNEGAGCVVDYLKKVNKKDKEEGEEDEEEEQKSEALFDYEATNGKLKKKRRVMGKEYTPDRNKPIDKINLRKGRLKAHSVASDIKRSLSMLVRDKKIKEDINLQSDIVNISLKNMRDKLREEEPSLFWDIYAPSPDSIEIKISIDLKTVGENNNYEELIRSILSESRAYKEFVDSLNKFNPSGVEMGKLYDISKFHFISQGDVVSYSFILKF